MDSENKRKLVYKLLWALLIALIILFNIYHIKAYAMTDFTCQSDCIRKGYSYGYCNSQCTYDSPLGSNWGGSIGSGGSGLGSGFQIQKIKQVNYACVSNCTQKGYLYSYCTQLCSY